MNPGTKALNNPIKYLGVTATKFEDLKGDKSKNIPNYFGNSSKSKEKEPEAGPSRAEDELSPVKVRPGTQMKIVEMRKPIKKSPKEESSKEAIKNSVSSFFGNSQGFFNKIKENTTESKSKAITDIEIVDSDEEIDERKSICGNEGKPKTFEIEDVVKGKVCDGNFAKPQEIKQQQASSDPITIEDSEENSKKPESPKEKRSLKNNEEQKENTPKPSNSDHKDTEEIQELENSVLQFEYGNDSEKSPTKPSVSFDHEKASKAQIDYAKNYAEYHVTEISDILSEIMETCEE